MDIPKTYNPEEAEQKWYDFWQARNYFISAPGGRPGQTSENKKPFTIVIPPPNVTGALHIGHALNNTLQDVITRFRRMQGYNALWVPGTDHGGIATQNVVERLLLAEGKTRQQLGREKFLEKMWQWKNESGDTILNQLKRLGCSCDWTRTKFTMDDDMSLAVMAAFVQLYNNGLIYRGNRMVNWCPRCQTALADIEVEHKEQKGNLWYILYHFKMDNGRSGIGGSHDSGGINETGDTPYVVVATTRPETMLGDTAVAVNPGDERYKIFIGRKLILPLVGREIPVVADELVDPAFGTGAVKVTPSHDPVDFAIAERHKLPSVIVIDETGKMTKHAGIGYAGLDRYDCRKKVVDDLYAKGLIEKTEDYVHSVGTCYRCHTVIEPLVSEQWFLSTKEIATTAADAVKSGRVKFYPESWASPCIDWLENLQDWCLSRQIWWGHRIPVWYCKNKKTGCKPVASVTRPPKCPVCSGAEIEQDPDVLDTWFSSALWPFTVFGWPDRNEEKQVSGNGGNDGGLRYYYPTSVLVTGYEILYLWVARMIMMGLKFMGDVPFRNVYIHGIVRDIHGKKMSKSLGNVVDPLEIMKQYGTDSLRFVLTQSSTAGRDIQISEDSFTGARNFCNKIWNAGRFILMNTTQENTPRQDVSPDGPSGASDPVDRWIISRYNECVSDVTRSFENYNPAEASRRLYDFFWSEFCDWYLELVKPRLAPGTKPPSALLEVFIGCLRMLHPIMPYITEELYQKVLSAVGPDESGQNGAFPESIMIYPWPSVKNEMAYPDDVRELRFIMELITNIRIIRAEMNVPVKQTINMVVLSHDNRVPDLIKKYIPNLKFMCRVDGFSAAGTKPARSAVTVIGDIEICIPLEGIIDFAKESARLTKTIAAVSRDIEILGAKLSNEKFLSRAPSQEVQKIRDFSRQNEDKLNRLKKYLETLEGK
ncbi:MAG: valine--tRNA ligase [Elusimicrobiota bacterium]